MSSFARSQLNPKSSKFSPKKKTTSVRQVGGPKTGNSAQIGSPLNTALNRTASTTPSQGDIINNNNNTCSIVPPPGFLQGNYMQSP